MVVSCLFARIILEFLEKIKHTHTCGELFDGILNHDKGQRKPNSIFSLVEKAAFNQMKANKYRVSKSSQYWFVAMC